MLVYPRVPLGGLAFSNQKRFNWTFSTFATQDPHQEVIFVSATLGVFLEASLDTHHQETTSQGHPPI